MNTAHAWAGISPSPVAVMNLPNGPAAIEPLRMLHRLDDLSVIHATASVSDKQIGHTAMTILAALGKLEDVRGNKGSHASDNVHLTPTWLAAHRTRLLILSSPHRWQPALLHQTVRLILAAGTQVLIATDDTHKAQVHESVAGFLPDDIHPHMLDALPVPAPTPATPTENIDWVRNPIPTVNWPTFRAECRDNLPPTQFSLVDDTYRAALRSTRRELTARPQRTPDNTTDHLSKLLEATSNQALATTVLRAAQAAHFEAGYNLRVDPAEVSAQLAIHQPARFTPNDWRAMRALRDPDRAAICTLHDHGLTLDQIRTYTIGDADTALRTQTINGTAMNTDAGAFMRAARLERSLHSAQAEDVLIEHTRPDRVLTNVSQDLGLRIPSKAHRRSHHTRNNWRYHLGYSLTKIGD